MARDEPTDQCAHQSNNHVHDESESGYLHELSSDPAGDHTDNDPRNYSVPHRLFSFFRLDADLLGNGMRLALAPASLCSSMRTESGGCPPPVKLKMFAAPMLPERSRSPSGGNTSPRRSRQSPPIERSPQRAHV